MNFRSFIKPNIETVNRLYNPSCRGIDGVMLVMVLVGALPVVVLVKMPEGVVNGSAGARRVVVRVLVILAVVGLRESVDANAPQLRWENRDSVKLKDFSGRFRGLKTGHGN